MATLSPLRYPGGKDKTYNYVKHLIQLNGIKTYIEPYAGGAAVAIRLLINNDVDRIIINDYDRSIFSLWNTIVSRPEELIYLIENTPITMEQWYIQKVVQNQKENADELSLAFSTLFLNRTNRSGIIKAGVIGGKNQDGKNKMDCRFNKEEIIKRITAISNHSDRIKVFNLDALDFIEKVVTLTDNSLTFFDPPYYCKGQALYTNFYEHEDHVDLALAINTEMLNKQWILTYDISKEIEDLYCGNNHIKYSLNYSISKPSKGQEFMFFSNNLNTGSAELFLNVISPS